MKTTAQLLAFVASSQLIAACSGDGGSTSDSSGGMGAAVDAGGGTEGSMPGTGGTDSATGGVQGEPPDVASCADTDVCPSPGIALAPSCFPRFMVGVNYAWQNFGGDFGGIAAWNFTGVAGIESEVGPVLADVAGRGANTVRWWMWPRLNGDGVVFDASDLPTGLGATVEADINAALRLADENNLYVMLTVFSFDNFGPTEADYYGTRSVGLSSHITDAGWRTALVENVIRPMARIVANSPNSDRMIAWDVINEPEWAITGDSLYGDEAFEANGELEAVTHAEMEVFVKDVIAGLRAESSAPISVGQAAAKWKNAFSQCDLDFYQIHIYDWVNDWWPYTQTPAQLGLSDKPVVYGEYPAGGLTGVDEAEMLETWYANGIAGGLSWAYTDPGFDITSSLASLDAFTAAHACETTY